MKITTIAVIAAVNIFLIALVLSSSMIIVINPMENSKTTERDVVFRWVGGNGPYAVIIDDNKELVSPEIMPAKNRTYTFSTPDVGTYYWKVTGKGANSSVHSFTIESSVAVSVLSNGSKTAIKNLGNTGLGVSIHTITGMAVLDVPYRETAFAENENMNITARQK